MALNSEDKADVSRSMGKALANKVSKVTRDKYGPLTMSLDKREPTINKPRKTGKFKTSYGTAGGSEYGGKKRPWVPAGVNYKAHGKGLNGPKN